MQSMSMAKSGINEALKPLAVDIDTLTPLPGNPRHGDIAAVKRSYAAFGQRKPIVARRADRVVLAGNHQLAAAKALEWDEIAVVWVDDDDLTAKAFALADNRTADLGSYDDEALLAMLMPVSDDADLLAATGYNLADLNKLLDEPPLAEDQSDLLPMSWQVVVMCSSEEQQLKVIDDLEAEGLQCRALVS